MLTERDTLTPDDVLTISRTNSEITILNKMIKEQFDYKEFWELRQESAILRDVEHYKNDYYV